MCMSGDSSKDMLPMEICRQQEEIKVENDEQMMRVISGRCFRLNDSESVMLIISVNATVNHIPALSLSAPQAAPLSTQHREPPHTDKMLPALCTLFTALSCVSGVTVVTQKPPVLTATKGEKITMHCNLGTVTNVASWYKQVPGGVPQDPSSSLSSLLNPPPLSPLFILRSVHHSADHTDNMLLTLCALLPALTWVSSQKVLTQTPSVQTDRSKTVTMDCNIAKDDGYYVYWYKQIPHTAPQFVLRFYRSHSSPYLYGDGFSSSRFTSKASSSIDYQLIISNVEAGDSAVYYCTTWDGSASAWVPQ
ncbi:hypothetical protein NFI96_004227 [Prochilodus magdalenae]|nr:hypothetical protein NFI96_004227 [Prochilodus magdalenae]